MIEPTDEMGEAWEKARRAYWAALEHDSGEGGLTLAEHEREARKQALAAVFELAERDYVVQPMRCPNLGTAFQCMRQAGHDGGHWGKLGEIEVRW